MTGKRSALPTVTDGKPGLISGAPVSAATSRATPYTERQWAKLGVSFKVSRVSSRRKCVRMSWPNGASAASSYKPPWSSDSLSSSAEHNIPWLSTPRKMLGLIRKGLPSSPGGSSAPTSAQGTRMPTRALGAPHTMLSKLPCPTSTWQTRRRSALGCCWAALISPTTIWQKGGATGLRSSTSRPAMVNTSANWRVLMGGLQNSRNQDSGNCIRLTRRNGEMTRQRMLAGRHSHLELRQKADIAVKKQPQIVHAIPQHGEAVDARAEGKPDVTLGVQPHIANHLRMHLA